MSYANQNRFSPLDPPLNPPIKTIPSLKDRNEVWTATEIFEMFRRPASELVPIPQIPRPPTKQHPKPPPSMASVDHFPPLISPLPQRQSLKTGSTCSSSSPTSPSTTSSITTSSSTTSSPSSSSASSPISSPSSSSSQRTFADISKVNASGAPPKMFNPEVALKTPVLSTAFDMQKYHYVMAEEGVNGKWPIYWVCECRQFRPHRQRCVCAIMQHQRKSYPPPQVVTKADPNAVFRGVIVPVNDIYDPNFNRVRQQIPLVSGWLKTPQKDRCEEYF